VSLLRESPEAPAYDDATGVGPTLRQRLRDNRGLVLISVIVVLVALLIALSQSRQKAGLLDPDAVDPSGSHALATLLRDQGVTVVRVTTAAAARDAVTQVPDSTLLVMPTAPLSTRMVDTVAGARSLVLVAPDTTTLDGLAPWALEKGAISSGDEVPPGCAWDVATRTGPLPATGPTFTTSRTDVASCWSGSVLDAPALGTTAAVTIVSRAEAFTNARLGDSGNAALALGTLGRTRTVVWWLPSFADPEQFTQDTQPSLQDLIPSWVGWALLQVLLAMVVVIWWRARRLGRVVVEPLPVVVRATEAVEGRARLYRRGHARGRAADALRASTLTRLRTRLSLPRTADVATVVAAVAARTHLSATEVSALLAPGTDPTDDVSLTRLATALDALENEVRHP
jgi:hypothetical protein